MPLRTAEWASSGAVDQPEFGPVEGEGSAAKRAPAADEDDSGRASHSAPREVNRRAHLRPEGSVALICTKGGETDRALTRGESR